MKIYNYKVEHSIGSASGSIEAESKSEAKRKLTLQYSSTYKDADGKDQKVEVTNIDLEDNPNG